MKPQTKSDPARWQRFQALIHGEFRPEFNRAVAIAVRRALREARVKQQEAEAQTPEPPPSAPDAPDKPDEALRQTVHDALVQAQYKVWKAQEAEAVRRYPDLSLEQELENPAFVRLLTDPVCPMTVCRAYEAVHLDDIRADIAREAVRHMNDRLDALSRRPRESGAAPQAGLPLHTGASDPKSRAEIARRALRGERVTL